MKKYADNENGIQNIVKEALEDIRTGELCNKKSQYIPTGWVCPKCGSVYSPTVSNCYRCNRPYQVTYVY